MIFIAAAKPSPFASCQSGASMIEVLVAILIFSIGLLGVASTQTVGLTNTQSALHRSYAAQLSYELIDSIRANPVEARRAVSVFTTFDTTGTVPAEVPKCLAYSAAGCSTDEMANTVLARWTARLKRTLPDGEATLTQNGEIFQLRIRWADFRNDQLIQTLNTNDANIAGDDIDKIADRITEFRI